MALREQQREATREQIIQAVHDVLAEESPAALSMPRIAERAGTSLRTLYRYFPTKEALVDAASESFRVPASVVGGSVNLRTLPDYMETVWTGFTEIIGAIRAQHITPAGRALRDARLPRNRQGVRESLVADGIDIPERDLDQLVDLIVTLMSSSTYLEMVDRLGHHEKDAARLAAWAVAACVDRARAEGGIDL
ncbi:MAG TPA: helix-turn-helix domain-containing protein [Acidimicrobiales bacterium]|nr:helix-turn-helix domain-containing protein [Acidimicrobiales bacterium]